MPIEVLHLTIGLAFLVVWAIVGEIVVRNH